MRKLLILSLATVTVTASLAVAQPTVRVEPDTLHKQRILQMQTRESVIRNYLHSWQSLGTALYHNSPNALDADFVGTAKDNINTTIAAQNALGVRTRYTDSSHDLQIVFYSPDGLSIELTDKVEYDVQLIDNNMPRATEHVTTRYIVILTPTETRWRVRIFQAVPTQ